MYPKYIHSSRCDRDADDSTTVQSRRLQATAVKSELAQRSDAISHVILEKPIISWHHNESPMPNGREAAGPRVARSGGRWPPQRHWNNAMLGTNFDFRVDHSYIYVLDFSVVVVWPNAVHAVCEPLGPFSTLQSESNSTAPTKQHVNGFCVALEAIESVCCLKWRNDGIHGQMSSWTENNNALV